MYFYEGRTIRGLAWITGALLIELGAVLAAGLALAATALLLAASLQSPSGTLTSAIASLAAVCGIGLGQVSMGAVCFVGLAQIYRGRHEYGLEHARSVDRAVLFLIVFLVISLVTLLLVLAPFATGTTEPGAPSPTLALLSGGNPILGPIAAFFAGLSLCSLTAALERPAARHRSRRGLVLGVIGAAAGPTLLGFAVGGSLTDMSSITSGVLASAVAGPGIAALSLSLFAAGFRETRKSMEAGQPMPALPRVEQVYPWARSPAYGYPPPPNPPRPPQP